MRTYLLYIDPSAVTYIMQAIIGVIIAGCASIIFYWRRVKRHFRKKREERHESKVQSGSEEV